MSFLEPLYDSVISPRPVLVILLQFGVFTFVLTFCILAVFKLLAFTVFVCCLYLAQ